MRMVQEIDCVKRRSKIDLHRVPRSRTINSVQTHPTLEVSTTRTQNIQREAMTDRQDQRCARLDHDPNVIRELDHECES